MDTTKLKKFAQFARRKLMEDIGAKLTLVLSTDSPARRENPEAIKALEKAIATSDQGQIIERVAYVWFNRFCALRFMDANRYTAVGIVSPAEGQFQPEILADAKMGHMDEDTIPTVIQQKVQALLSGRSPSKDSQGEAYRLLVVSACRAWHRAMPFLFQPIDDYTELLMPDDLLSGNSILAYTREAMTPDACEDVEVIGWLYQFYISEKKENVDAKVKRGEKVETSEIPAKTALFTPHWIVRYLVDNSLGRLWMLNHPQSRLIEQMEYYIPPEKHEADFLRINSPEDIKVCDPACGSGHILTYAFDLLHAIYEEEGYAPSEIPEKILTHNLFGIELDERAGELAAFALSMKARARQRRFLSKGIRPQICMLEKVEFDATELDDYLNTVGRDLFTKDLRETLTQFDEADNFGSLIQPKAQNVSTILATLETKDLSSNLFLAETHQKVLKVLQMAEYLSQRYSAVVANPPYLGKGMNGRLSTWTKKHYPNSKSDLFAMFIERGFDLIPQFGYSAMVTMQSWMFLSSYETLRKRILRETSIECLVHMANMVMGIAFGTAATVLKKGGSAESRGAYCYVEYEDINNQGKPATFPPQNERNSKAETRASLT